MRTTILIVCLVLCANAHVRNGFVRLLGVGQAAASTSAHPGVRVAAAAIERTKSLVIYNPAYVKMKYPGGDVPSYYGVCTDVVIRTYRKVGIDLQKKVFEAFGGDRNIQHRRVRVLRRFFAKYGQSLRITKNPADYKPGDLVTYYLPDARYSKDHIAIVTDRKTRDGVPLVVHNIGWGPRLENFLFEAKITGHYRYLPKMIGSATN